jgi:hypothetical protein
VTTVLLLLLLLGVTAVLGFLSLFTVMATDSCGTGSGKEPAVCDSGYMAVILLGYWAGLLVVPLLALVASVVAMSRHRLAWPYAAAGLLCLGVVTLVYVVLLTR